MRRIAVAIFSLTLVGAAHANMLPPQTTTPHSFFAGTWSFDNSCASGDGMTLKADGKAAYDEWGDGLWASAENGKRLVLIVEDIREDADKSKPAQLIEFRDILRIGPQLSMTRASDGVKIKARRCATTAN